MLRESRPAARIRARAEALRRYLHEFGRLDEKPPAGVVLWSRYLVFAELFGMAEETRSELRRQAGRASLTFGSITWTLDSLLTVPSKNGAGDSDERDVAAEGDLADAVASEGVEPGAATAPPSAS
jgi:hypothetical protein